ncbi:STAS domain-containing protein [Actinoplanes sp. CA-252034]|uniref:STAS domain-containing protein n=1 Tax=Actinoplanes sp. CA-252034 TaxID=3239906 RepID=UPI003D99CAE2
MNIVRLDDGAATRLTLRGELDMETGDLVEEQVARVLAGRPAELVVDLEGLTFCDSSGIDVLLAARETAVRAGVAFRVTRPSGIVLRSLTITGVLPLLTGSDRETAGGRP